MSIEFFSFILLQCNKLFFNEKRRKIVWDQPKKNTHTHTQDRSAIGELIKCNEYFYGLWIKRESTKNKKKKIFGHFNSWSSIKLDSIRCLLKRKYYMTRCMMHERHACMHAHTSWSKWNKNNGIGNTHNARYWIELKNEDTKLNG